MSGALNQLDLAAADCLTQPTGMVGREPLVGGSPDDESGYLDVPYFPSTSWVNRWSEGDAMKQMGPEGHRTAEVVGDQVGGSQ